MILFLAGWEVALSWKNENDAQQFLGSDWALRVAAKNTPRGPK